MSLLQTADVERILAELSRERPVFHSEADFQLALAFHLNCLTHPRVKPFEDELTRYAEFRYLLVRVMPRE